MYTFPAIDLAIIPIEEIKPTKDEILEERIIRPKNIESPQLMIQYSTYTPLMGDCAAQGSYSGSLEDGLALFDIEVTPGYSGALVARDTKAAAMVIGGIIMNRSFRKTSQNFDTRNLSNCLQFYHESLVHLCSTSKHYCRALPLDLIMKKIDNLSKVKAENVKKMRMNCVKHLDYPNDHRNILSLPSEGLTDTTLMSFPCGMSLDNDNRNQPTVSFNDSFDDYFDNTMEEEFVEGEGIAKKIKLIDKVFPSGR